MIAPQLSEYLRVDVVRKISIHDTVKLNINMYKMCLQLSILE